MPDENSTTIWNSQISQDEKTEIKQSWGDFMLDFWDEKTEHMENPTVETNSLEDDNNKDQISNFTNIDFDTNDASWEEKDESEIQGLENGFISKEAEANKEPQIDFDISMDNTSKEELKEMDNNWVAKEILLEEKPASEDNIEIENLDNLVVEMSEDLNNDNLDKKDEEIRDDETVMDQNDIFDNIEKDNEDSENIDREESEESKIVLDDNQENENSEEINNFASVSDDVKDDEMAELSKNNEDNKDFDFDWEKLEESNESDNHDIYENSNEGSDNEELNNTTLDSNMLQENNESKMEEASENLELISPSIIDDNKVDEDSIEDDKVKDIDVDETSSDIEDFWVENDENITSDEEVIDKDDTSDNKNSETLDFVMDIEPESEKEPENQTENWNFLGDESTNLSQDDSSNITNEDGNVSELSQKTEEIFNENKELESTSSNSVIETPSYNPLDEKDEMWSINQDDNDQPEALDENIDLNWSEVLDSQAETVNVAANSLQQDEIKEIKQDNIESEPVTSTLSLDQILDSELNDNPDFVDSSKAVPNNVSVSSGLFGNKKMVWIVAWVWVFLLAWFCVILAFPFWWTDRKAGSTVNTWDVVLTWDHYSPDPENPDEYTWIIIDWPTTTIISEEPEEPEEPENPSEPWEPQPFIPCTDIDCPWEEPEESEEPEEKLDASYVSDKISSFKSQAERYYLKWDDMQDKKLIKYAAQAIHLCEVYQEQVENGEWLDEETLSSFKTKMNSLLNNMDKYLNWDDDSPTRVKSNYDDEYDFDWKDELLDYIYNGSSY